MAHAHLAGYKFVFVFIWGENAENPQPALRPVFTAARCATLCVQVFVCMDDVLLLL